MLCAGEVLCYVTVLCQCYLPLLFVTVCSSNICTKIQTASG